jgi:hypothetical protein
MKLQMIDSYRQITRTQFTLSILLVSLLSLLVGCKSGEPASNAAAKSAPADNSNQAMSSAGGKTNASSQGNANASAKASEPAQLLGTFESREVLDQGVVTLITQLRTLWMFSADGSYSRVSEVKGKPYHADSGNFRVEQPDKLVLTIQITGLKGKREIQNPPLTKTHIFSLSPDGEELRLTSAKGSVGIFRRVSKPNTP